MKLPKVLLLLLAAFAAGMLADRQLIKREAHDFTSSMIIPQGNSPSLLNRAPLANVHAPQNDVQGKDKRPINKASLMQLLSMDNEDAMRHAMHSASAAELKKLLADTQSLDASDPVLRQVKRALYGEWAHKEPKLALAAVLKETDRRLQEMVIHTAFAQLAREDLGAAKLAFQQLQTRRQRDEAVGAHGAQCRAIRHAKHERTRP